MTLTRFGAGSVGNRLLFWVSPAILLLVWSWACHSRLFPPQILIAPEQVWQTFVELLGTGELEEHLYRSLYRLAVGFLIGSVLGLGFGVALSLSKRFEGLFLPIFNAVRQVPTIAFIPMLILLFGVEETFKIVIVAKATFFPVALSAYDAAKGVSKSYLEVARVYRLPTVPLVWRVIFPAVTPPVLTGLRLALSRSWVVLVAAELLAADSGLGQMMEMGRQMFRIDVVMVGVVLTGTIGFALDRGFMLIEHRLVRWKRY